MKEPGVGGKPFGDDGADIDREVVDARNDPVGCSQVLSQEEIGEHALHHHAIRSLQVPMQVTASAAEDRIDRRRRR